MNNQGQHAAIAGLFDAPPPEEVVRIRSTPPEVGCVQGDLVVTQIAVTTSPKAGVDDISCKGSSSASSLRLALPRPVLFRPRSLLLRLVGEIGSQSPAMRGCSFHKGI
jgi:hypothetical protein